MSSDAAAGLFAIDDGQSPKATAESLDLNNCDLEPIHVPGRIQPHGFLVVLTPDWVVSKVSANIEAFTGSPPEAWLGQPLISNVDPVAAHTLRNLAVTLFGPDAVQRTFAIVLIAGQPPFDVALHRAGDALVIEAEPAVADEREAAALIRAMVARLKHSIGLPAFYRDATRHVQALTGFGRVMIYRLGAQGHGEVVAEALRGYQNSYMGLHYPASDIPVQARALYLRNSFRIIADVAAEPVLLVALSERDAGPPLDQSLSVLRAVAPVHIEYLRNMEVAASLSISIIVDGKLWGLFACHHPAARLPSFAYRTAAELFGEMFSMQLEGRLRREADMHDQRARALAALLVAEVAHDQSVLQDARRLAELIFDTIPGDGMAICIDGAVWPTGKTPSTDACKVVASMLAEQSLHKVFATDCAASLMPPGSLDGTAGFIAIPLMRGPQDFILLFRSELTQIRNWAGDPDKQATEHNGKISPRQSFEAWAELVHGRCEPFTASEQEAAETIRAALGESRFHSSDVVPEAPVRGQDMLIAELNHRVRNILALIQGLISQTRGGAETVEAFVTTLDYRVQSLARAHDQITSDRWGPANLKDLVATEAAAYLDNRRDRVSIDGANILVYPAAFTTLALVFHELMTNAAKYGALSSTGVVAIDWRSDDDGDLLVDWVERGGPPVATPTRRGFGSTIIERAIPYDLGGTAAVEYGASGFSACFKIPARHLAGVSTTVSPAQTVALVADRSSLLAGLNVLLVEDNIIIAMDCAEMLQSLGAAHVTMAASVTEALDALDAQVFQFALLDFNLGVETSLGVADVLLFRGIPFAFATGYDGDLQDRGHANAPVIGKPYGTAQLVPLLRRLGFGSPG
ncbi:GAF domain-containing protein [Polymorphobacter megasporae]|nr:GAF domain-containing protein [Polymorphobacter megasporae]